MGGNSLGVVMYLTLALSVIAIAVISERMKRRLARRHLCCWIAKRREWEEA
jgi:hypothetical protein